VIGEFEAFRTWAQLKYNVDIESDEECMHAISEVHTKRAEGVIEDSNEATFNAKVNALFQRRADYLSQGRKVLAGHRETIAQVGGAVADLTALLELMTPHIANMYALHHPAVKEDAPEDPAREESGREMNLRLGRELRMVTVRILGRMHLRRKVENLHRSQRQHPHCLRSPSPSRKQHRTQS
jgi:hypothetical protein